MQPTLLPPALLELVDARCQVGDNARGTAAEAAAEEARQRVLEVQPEGGMLVGAIADARFNACGIRMGPGERRCCDERSATREDCGYPHVEVPDPSGVVEVVLGVPQ